MSRRGIVIGCGTSGVVPVVWPAADPRRVPVTERRSTVSLRGMRHHLLPPRDSAVADRPPGRAVDAVTLHGTTSVRPAVGAQALTRVGRVGARGRMSNFHPPRD